MTNELENPKNCSEIYKNSLPQEKKLGVEKSKAQKSWSVLRNIENFEYNSAENDDFDDGRIWKSKMPVQNL